MVAFWLWFPGTQNQVAGALVHQCWLGFSLSDPGSQAAGLKRLPEERTDEDKDLCLGRKAGWEMQEARCSL